MPTVKRVRRVIAFLINRSHTIAFQEFFRRYGARILPVLIFSAAITSASLMFTSTQFHKLPHSF